MKFFMATQFLFPTTVFAVISLCAAVSAEAQRTVRHELIRGDMPPGLAADCSRMGNPALEFHEQAVRIVAPLGSRVEVGSTDGFIRMDSSHASLGLKIGPVYRLKVTNIPRHSGKELYPSVELLNRLYPPKGLENEFPVQIVITEDDLAQALDGRLVTKVIYLEDPETALPHRHEVDKQPYFDVGGGEDALRAAEKMGRPMAILRIGSRIPMATETNDQFNFHAPSPTLLPDPQTIRSEPNWEAFDESKPVISGEPDWDQFDDGEPVIRGEFIPSTDEH